jgi:hypothetical protein
VKADEPEIPIIALKKYTKYKYPSNLKRNKSPIANSEMKAVKPITNTVFLIGYRSKSNPKGISVSITGKNVKR